MPNRIEARSAKAALTNATGRLPLLRLFSTPLIDGCGVKTCNGLIEPVIIEGEVLDEARQWLGVYNPKR